MSTARGTGAPGRVAWLDLARALSIILVVLYHVGVTSGPELLGTRSTAARVAYDLNLALIPLRMPLFFLIAGALAAGAIHRPFPRVVRPRLLDLLWPYLLWSLLFAAIGWPRYAPGDPLGFLGEEITGLLVVASPYWFIAALAIFFLLARAGREHRTLLVALAVLAHLAAPFLWTVLRERQVDADLAYGIFQITDNALWYLLGYVLRDALLAARRLVISVALAIGLPLAVAFVLLAMVVLDGGLGMLPLRGIELAASLTGIGACVALLPVVARWRPAARTGRYVGSRTLVIYLVHPLVLNVVVILWNIGGVRDSLPGTAAEMLIVPALTALAVAVALLVDRLLDRRGPRWLLKAPGGREMGNTAQAHRPSS